MRTTLDLKFVRVLIISIPLLLITIRCTQKQIDHAPKAKLPNIIYVLADDLGYGDISGFNPDGKIKTPHIDLLARQGIKFVDAHTSSSVCTPTRYGILTGRYNWRSSLKSGVLTGKSKALIPNGRATVASILKGEGYHTAFIGKWHLGWDWALKDTSDFGGEGWNQEDFDAIDFSKPISHSPNDLGFDYAYGHSGSLDMAPYVYVENNRTTAKLDRQTENTDKYSWWRKGPTALDFKHEDVTPNFFRKSIKYIQEKSKAEHPFFLYLALPSPHTPILPSEAWQGKSKLNPYGDFVMMIDDFMGQLVSSIEQAGIEENTLIIFTSDNGCSPEADFDILAKKGHHPSYIYRGHKADIYEGGHRVPFIAKWPSKIKPGGISQKTICTTDFMATCADIINLKLKDNVGEDSFSLLPLFDEPNTRDYERKATVHHSINGSFAIRKKQWKLIFAPDSGGWSYPKPGSEVVKNMPPFQLYDLHNDPSEQYNLYNQYPEIIKELKQLMVKYIEDGRSTQGLSQKNDTSTYGNKKWNQIEIFYKK